MDAALADMIRAYELLGVSRSAPARAIKRSYRALAKRWHPDLYQPGSPEHANATYMMKAINEAYALVENAPLRFRGAEVQRPASPPLRPRSTTITIFADQERDLVPLDTTRLDFWARFLCGALVGFLPSCYLQFRLLGYLDNFMSDESLFLYFVWVIGTLACGFVAAFVGNDLWFKITGATDMTESSARPRK